MSVWAVGITAAVGVGTSVYNNKKADARADAALAAADRDLVAEAHEINEANRIAAPAEFDLESIYSPKYAALNRGIAQDNLFGGKDVYAFMDQAGGHAGGLKEGYANALKEGGQTAANAWLERAIANTQDPTLINQWQNAARTGGGTVDMNLKAVEQIGEANRQANTLQRQADINDAAAMGGDVQALQKSLNPELYDNLTKVDQMALGNGPSDAETALGASLANADRNRVNLSAVDDVAAVSGPRSVSAPGIAGGDIQALRVGSVQQQSRSKVLSELEKQAADDLALGGSLDSRTMQDIEQNMLEHYNATGRAGSNRAQSAIAAELARASSDLKNERFNRAATAENAIQSHKGMNVDILQGNQNTQAQISGLDLQAKMANQDVENLRASQNLEAQKANQAAGLATNELNAGIAQGNQSTQLSNNQLAIGASGQNQAIDNATNENLLNLANLSDRRDATNFTNMQQAVGNRIATQFDPFTGVLGRSSLNNTNFADTMANSNFANSSSGTMDAFNSYASNLNGQQSSNANALALQGYNSADQFMAGGIGMAGNLAGSYLSSTGG